MFPWLVCGILTVVTIVLFIRIILLHQGMEEICTEFRENLSTDTNTLIVTRSGDRHVRRLASEINTQLRLLRRQQVRYLNGDRELKEAVTNISHDLRTPLTAICGYLELLEQEEVSAPVQRYVEQIENRTEMLKTLTEELFRYSVLTSIQEETKTDVVINRVLEESLMADYGAFTQRGIVPQIEIPGLPVHRLLDASALSRIFENILSNALKYSDGDLKVIMGTDGTVTFSNASGELTPVMVERLFDRFYTVETGRLSTGLGLSIAKLLAERMGGTVQACYGEGRLTITVFFPKE